MRKYDYLIIGGGIAGVTAAETIRREDSSATIGIFADEPHLLYSRVNIPSYLKHRISREQIFLRRQEDFTKREIDLHLEQTVSFVNSAKNMIELRNGFKFSYGKLLIASGGRVKPWGKEEDAPFTYRLQTLDDADRMMKSLGSIRHPLIIGSSFISLEFLEIFNLNNISPAMLSQDAYFFANILDSQGGELMRNNFDRFGIRYYFNDSIKETEKKENELKIITGRLFQLSSDALCAGIGLVRSMEFLTGSGVSLGRKGVLTNEFLRTNIENIFAAGDVAEYFDVILERHWIAGNWTNSFLQGRCAALNMLGKNEPYRRVATYSLNNLGMQITVLGDTSKENETAERVYPEKNKYERFFMRKGILVGAALINSFSAKSHISRIIDAKTSVERYKNKFQNSEFDVSEIEV